MGARDGLETAEDGTCRCWWSGAEPLYRAYHDDEWGLPVADDTRLFEKLILEGFQAGLSWWTILRKRERFREVFRGFDIDAVARFNSRSVERLLKDAGIVRHRGKIESTINNARRARELIDEFGSLAAFVWRFVPSAEERPRTMTKAALTNLGSTPRSAALSKDLKKRGWSYVGPTTMYAFMQAMGLVNDHLEGCDARARVIRARGRFRVPSRQPE